MASSFNPETPGVELPRDGPGALALGHASRPDRLADKRILTAVVRVVLDDRGRLVHGEVLDARGGVRVRFQRWPRLIRAIRTSLRVRSSSRRAQR